LGRPRRWVTYAGDSDPTTVPAEWHGWLHYTTDTAPPDQQYQKRHWELPHRPNMTGTPEAYRPKGSALNAGKRTEPVGDYEPWRPSR
ncbi:MAG: NADH-ubiquinone oxidoreductase subunit NDUFA12 family protein, partial [Hyphomicrobiaceae bacterium]